MAKAKMIKSSSSLCNEDTNIEDNPKFKEAYELCLAIFHNQINNPRTGVFNYTKVGSIKATIKGALKTYDIDVFRYLNEEMMRDETEKYGSFYFNPALFLNWLKEAKEKLEKQNIAYKEEEKKPESNLQTVSIQSLIPDIFDGKRVLPNVFLRSALFGIVRTGRRQVVKEEAVASMSQYEVYFSGEQFDQNDLAILDSLVFLLKQKNLEFDLKLSMYELCKFMDYSQSKTNRDAIKSRISRLQFGQVKIKYNHKTYAGSFIDDFFIDEEDGKIAVRLNKKLFTLFTTNDYTLFNKKIQECLGENQLARWLFHFYESHQDSLAFKLDYLKKLSRSDSEQKSFNRTLKSSLSLLKKAYQQNQRCFDYKIQNSSLHVSYAQPNHSKFKEDPKEILF